MNKKKVYNSQFKIKVALEALRENNTTLEVSKRYQVHIQTLRDWIRIVRKNGHNIFDDKREKNSSQSDDKELSVLKQKAGELIMENYFLKNTRLLGIDERIKMIRPCKKFSIRKQCQFLEIHRLTFYYNKVNATDSEILNLIYELWQDYLMLGYKKQTVLLQKMGCNINHKKVWV